MQSQKICIWLSSNAVRVPVKSFNHKPQASGTWQARLESAFSEMLVKRRGWVDWKDLRSTTVWVAEKFPSTVHSFILLLVLAEADYPTEDIQLSQDVSHILPFSEKRCHLLRFSHTNYYSTHHLYSDSHQHGRSATVLQTFDAVVFLELL